MPTIDRWTSGKCQTSYESYESYESVSHAVSKKATKPLATPSSVQLSAALELLATALVCTLSYCLFSLCNSGNVTLRIGKCSFSDPALEAGGEGMGNVSAVGIAWRWDKRDVVIAEVVLVRVCSAFGAGFALYKNTRRQPKNIWD